MFAHINWWIVGAGMAYLGGAVMAFHRGNYKVAALSLLYAIANAVMSSIGE